MTVLLPQSLDEACAALAARPEATLLAGGTDLMVAVNAGRQPLTTVIALDRVDGLRQWRHHDGHVELGAGLTYADLGQPDLRFSATMLREHGNLSSAFVYFVLQAALADGVDGADDGWWWLSSFGAGFSCHGALLEVRAG